MRKYWMLLTLFLGVKSIYAQNEQEEIKKEDVVVEFSFNPTLSDVFKLKTNPTIEENTNKAKVIYNIYPKKVQSDFNPTIKRATYLKVDKSKIKNYRNYIYAAAGLYGNMELEAFIKPKSYKKMDYGFSVYHHNKQKGIDDERVENDYLNTNLNFYIGKELKKLDWKAAVIYDRNAINWYGLSSLIVNPTVYQNKNFNQIYNTVNVHGTVAYKNGKVKSLSPSIQFFSDEYGTTETQIKAEAVIDKSLLKNLIETNIKFEYLNGSFSQNYINDDNVAYSFINISVLPSYTYIADNFKINASLNLSLNINTEASKTKFFFLPSIETTVPVVKNIMIFKGGIKSAFTQHTYASLVEQNSYVSPTLNIDVSDTPVKLFAGLEGELSHKISYNTEISYSIQNNKALFVNNTSLPLLQNVYQYGNTFSVVYDDIKVLSLKANVEAAIVKNLKGGLNVMFNNFKTNNVEEVWNVPSINVETYTNYQFNKWFGQLGINFVGNRKDLVNNTTIDIDGFMDINIKGGYKINKKLNAHLNMYNVLNNNYETFVNYQVQGFQAVAGISYKF